MDYDNIPSKLVDLTNFAEDVSLLVGENGSGKSTLLNDLSKFFLRNRKDVIAVANSIHDKFDVNHKNIKALRGRSGRRQTRSTIKNSLENIAKQSNIQGLKNAGRVLQYVGFHPVIGFKIDRLHYNFKDVINSSEIEASLKSQLIYLIERFQNETSLNEVFWLEADSFSYSEIERSSLLELFLWETELKNLKVFTRIDVFLRKGERIISILNASSGELALITTMVYVSTVITEDTVILIDEPENSLHPKWQKEYVKTFFDLFFRYQPKLIIATHSPLVINGAELFTPDPKIYKSNGFKFIEQMKEPLNVEELYFRFFDINTPQNRFLSDYIIRLLNLLANSKIGFDYFQIEINRLKDKSYDPKQIALMDSVIQLASNITNTPIN